MLDTRRNRRDGFRSQRSMALGRRGMVCTSQPLASAAGLDCLRRGGNAMDAAITAAAVLGVAEPFSTGIGGDCFLLFWNESERRLHGLNGSGAAPAAASVEALRSRGFDEVPLHGLLSVTVPGAVDAWHQALERFGTMSLGQALAPAIGYAEDGFAVTEIIAYQWEMICRAGVLQNTEAQRVFSVDGEAPRLGSVVRLPELAQSMRCLAEGGRDVFYLGELAERISAFSQSNGGLLAGEDLAAHRSEWVEPISTDYRGYRLYEIPPNGQGLAALIALNILENFDLGAHQVDAAEIWHLRVESMKLALADRDRYIADPRHAGVPTAELLSKDYAQGRAALIQPRRVLSPAKPGTVHGGADTVYLTTADAAGNVVSLINSLYGPFGSGVVAGDTGIALQNRGHGFVLDPGHANCLSPRKRPLHTIIPAMLFAAGRPLVSFGVMGGEMQAQGHLQVVSNLVDGGLNIQEALDYPRFHCLGGVRVAVEDGCPPQARSGLAERGHRVEDESAALFRGGFGGGQGIVIEPGNRVYWGGSDFRKDGCAIGY